MPYKITRVLVEGQEAPDAKKGPKSAGRHFEIASVQGQGSYTLVAGKGSVLKMQEKVFVRMKSSPKAKMGYAIDKNVEIKREN